MISVVMIAPSAQLSFANSMGQLFGYDEPGSEGSFSVALSQNGLPPETHYGCHIYAHQLFLDQINSGIAGTLSNLPTGVTISGVQALLNALIISIENPAVSSAYDHFSKVLSDNGLSRVVTGLK